MFNKTTKISSRTINRRIHKKGDSGKAGCFFASDTSDSTQDEKPVEIKRQLKALVMKGDMELIKNVVYFYFLMNPGAKPRSIFMKWYNHSVLADYTRPELSRLRRWITEFQQEIYGN